MSESEKMVEGMALIAGGRISERDLHNHDVQHHHEICMELNDMYQKKNADYGDSFRETYHKLGIISAVTRITDKVNRLQSLTVNKQQVADESIRDTLLDLANYAIMTAMELEEPT